MYHQSQSPWMSEQSIQQLLLRYLSLRHSAGTANRNCWSGYPGQHQHSMPDSCINTFCNKIRCIMWEIHFKKGLSLGIFMRFKIQDSRFNLLSSLCVRKRKCCSSQPIAVWQKHLQRYKLSCFFCFFLIPTLVCWGSGWMCNLKAPLLSCPLAKID